MKSRLLTIFGITVIVIVMTLLIMTILNDDFRVVRTEMDQYMYENIPCLYGYHNTETNCVEYNASDYDQDPMIIAGIMHFFNIQLNKAEIPFDNLLYDPTTSYVTIVMNASDFSEHESTMNELPLRNYLVQTGDK